MSQPVVNIGMVGHVDHGKTTLVSALSGVWSDTHSEELKRGISIRLGYADCTFYKCKNCNEPECYCTTSKCPTCGGDTEEIRTISFVDSPGHETLMATMLSGAAIMDGAVLVIAANEPCPQPQTKEHLMALDIIGIKNVVIAQNKIDIVSREDALKHYNQIKAFVKGTVAENAPIVPISAQQKVNIDVLIKTIEEKIPTPKHDLDKPVTMFVARSFDVNRPGTTPAKLSGGVIGGTISHGKLAVKDEIEIRPGRRVESENRESWVPITTTVTRLIYGGEAVDIATPGGLLAVGTKLDPAMTKSDGMAGQVVGKPGTLPPVWQKFVMKTQLLDRVVGVSEDEKVKPIATSEPLMLSVGTSMTIGVVTSARKDEAEVKLKRPVCAEVGSRIAISRRIGARWRLIGVGELIG
ncbi:translation initiation factor IF-2 subunit gamma [Methanocella arvoryzae]|uniref:Translation initiation factor 2 subunit gamma n=1 Tax=Methanocella arvoryzae (strain DSM 22066 / NBRC 105507 / MRE50) TaxID=351160 RepID=Q0W371_METAR|nr:translation initiation factor IF-2 subunit gamma [Methanocella arvoryzae]CAJ37172.1 translation initiation factor 2, gamma subunit [Methanocella arvoryzae MRE50]